MRFSARTLIPLSVTCVLLLPNSSLAQVLYGTLVGRVQDSGGASVAGAEVDASDAQTGLAYHARTDGSGEFNLRNLQPGTYTFRVRDAGFADAETAALVVAPNQTVRADTRLAPQGVAQTVNVSASSAQLQTDSGALQATLSSHALENLPITGFNNYQSLLSLLPGATPSRLQNSVMDTPARSLTTNINGASRNNNLTLIDGAAIQQVYLPHHTLYNPPTEDIQSVDIVTNSFNADQGVAGGVVVNVFTKSGTNDFHGALWELHTNSSLAARNYFYNRTYFAAAGNDVPKNILNEFGANVGGPIVRNRLFFFSGFEGLSQRQLYPTLVSVPTDAMRTGDFTGLSTIYNPATGNADGTGRVSFATQNVSGRNAIESGISPAALRVLALIPHANLPGTSNNYSVAGTYSLDRFSFDEKATWQIDSRSSLFVKYSSMSADAKSPSTLGMGGGTGLSPGGANAGSGYSETRVKVGGVGYSRTFSSRLLLDANFGYGRNDLRWYENDFATNLGPGLGIPGTNGDRNGGYGQDANQQGLPSFAVTGFETFGNPDAYTPELKHDQTFTYNANLTYSVGRHTLRFGTQLVNNRLNEYQPQRGFGPRGGFTFTGGVTALRGGASSNFANAFAQFLLGAPDSLGKSYQYLNPITGIEWQSGIYAQDQWQASDKLTVNVGLRWEYYPIMTRNGRGLERYDPSTNQVILGGVQGQPNGAGTTASKLQFAPRFGFAYRADEKTVLRGGFGISIDPYPFTRAMRDPYPITIAQTVNATNSYVAAGSLTAGIPGYDTVAPTVVNGIAALPLAAYTKTLLPGTFRRGYLESYNLTLERSLPKQFSLATSYVGAHTVRQTVYFEANAGQTPGMGSAGQPLYTAFGRAAQTQVILPYGTSHYDALQMSLKHPLSAGVLLSLAYTYSKSLDQASDDDSVPLFNAAAYQYRNYAVSDFDRRHNLEVAVVADLPFGHGHPFLNGGGPAAAVLGGWRVNGVVSRFTGLPFTPLASATSLNAPFNTQVANQLKPSVQRLGGIGKFSTYFDTSAFTPVTTASFGNAARNSVRGPGHSELDLGLARVVPITERVHFELRAEAFNVTNTPFFGLPGNNVSNSSFGLITSTFGSSADNRVLRFTGKINF